MYWVLIQQRDASNMQKMRFMFFLDSGKTYTSSFLRKSLIVQSELLYQTKLVVPVSQSISERQFSTKFQSFTSFFLATRLNILLVRKQVPVEIPRQKPYLPDSLVTFNVIFV